MKRNKIAVIGLGNRLLADEGAGLHALALLRQKIGRKLEDESSDDGIDLVEAGTPGMSLLHQLEEREKIIFIDAGFCGCRPGWYQKFRPEEIISHKATKNQSLHEFDLIRFLEFARQMNLLQDKEIVIYCIQIAEMGMSEFLSHRVEEGIPALVQEVYQEIWPHLQEGK
jgi:hydrogenase maturation protease